MKNGYLVREFARLTRVTVRTLHYYDQLGLLEPSFERPNGYRVYTDADLLKLQQIVTLKFMGFSLDEIKRLLASKGYEAAKALKHQSAAVKDEIARLREASRAIDQVLARLEKDGRVPRQKLIKIMEVIQMGEDVKKGWHEKFFSEEDLRSSPRSARTTRRRHGGLSEPLGRPSSPRSRPSRARSRKPRGPGPGPSAGRPCSTRPTAGTPSSRPRSPRPTSPGPSRRSTT